MVYDLKSQQDRATAFIIYLKETLPWAYNSIFDFDIEGSNAGHVYFREVSIEKMTTSLTKWTFTIVKNYVIQRKWVIFLENGTFYSFWNLVVNDCDVSTCLQQILPTVYGTPKN